MCGTSTNGFCPLKFSLLSSRRFENRRVEVEKERFSVHDLNKKERRFSRQVFNGNYEIARPRNTEGIERNSDFSLSKFIGVIL